MSLGDWANLATIGGVLVALVVLFYTARQIHQNTEVSRGQFLLALEEMFRRHDTVHLKLRPGGEWAERGKGPATPQELAELEDYMGLFEHCEALLRNKLVDADVFRSIFAYRLRNLVANDKIVHEKLINERIAAA